MVETKSVRGGSNVRFGRVEVRVTGGVGQSDSRSPQDIYPVGFQSNLLSEFVENLISEFR